MAHYFGKLKREGEVSEEYAIKLASQKIQSFIYACNQPYTRGANQSGFYNISLYDNAFLDNILINYAALEIDRADVLQLQALFLDVMNETFKTTPLTFPIISACFNTDKANKIVDIEYFEEVCIANTEFAFINFYFGKTSTLSSCCRLRSDTEYFNLFGGGGGTKIGSLGVVTLNLPRIAQATNFSAELERLVRLANDINLVKRKLIEEYINIGALPLYTHDFMALNTQYSTVGLVGINEMLENLGLDILTKNGQDFVAMVQADINKQIDEYAKLTGNPHNLEQVPAENSAIKLAQKDRVMGYNSKYEIYSNQFIPLTTNADILDRIKLQGMFDSKMSGGSILHINIEEEMAAGDMIDLVSAAANKGVIYMGINYNLQKCEEGHIVPHRGDKCPICGAGITDNFIRVVGFIVNTKNFHRVRREGEYLERKFYQY
jgi:ribonucleoside-triphosphate reductase